MQVKDLGEFGVIDLLNGMVTGQRARPQDAAPPRFPLLVDTGDDTAAWRAGDATELLTTDTVVEGAHFTRQTIPWRDLGWKSVAANISDIASMGGVPSYALVTLGLPPETLVEDLQELYLGMLEIANRYGVAIVGGDMVRSPIVFITVALTGILDGNPMLRTTAKPGDLVAVTGCLGSPAGGLKILLDGDPASPQAAKYLIGAHRRPVPEVEAGQTLLRLGISTAMDISDGLVDDLGKLCQASGVSAQVNADLVPVHPMLQETFPGQCLDMALNGGEDYKLLFATSLAQVQTAQAELPDAVCVVGKITPGNPGRVTILDSNGAESAAGRRGWDHFS